MWILPTNLLTTFPSVADTVELGLDLNEFCQLSAKSVMWRSKPMQSQICATRCKRAPWFRRLYGQTLNPSTFRRFEKAWNKEYCQAVFPVSRLVQPASEKQQKTPDTYGPTYLKASESADQQLSFWKTSKELLAQKQAKGKAFLNMSSEVWKKWVTELRQDCSRRLKLAHLTKGKESLSWATPTVHGNNNAKGASKKSGNGLNTQVKNWPTPTARDWKDGTAESCKNVPSNCLLGREVHKASAGLLAPTKTNTTGKNPESWGTPSASDYKGHPGKNSRQKRITKQRSNPNRLNPSWVEQLMGLPVGWTDFDS